MKARPSWIVVALVGASLAVVIVAFGEVPDSGKLWAALGVPEPFVTTGRVDQLMIHFVMINDEKRPVDPRVGSWRLNVNGKNEPDSELIFNNGPRDERWRSLPPGDRLQFAYALGALFKKPGIYRIIWAGEGFESAPLMLRVVSDVTDAAQSGAFSGSQPIPSETNRRTSSGPVLGAADITPTPLPPSVSLKDAVRVAEDYVAEKKIDVSQHYLASIRTQSDSQGRLYWDAQWMQTYRRFKGGWFIIRVQMDKTATLIPGK